MHKVFGLLRIFLRRFGTARAVRTTSVLRKIPQLPTDYISNAQSSNILANGFLKPPYLSGNRRGGYMKFLGGNPRERMLADARRHKRHEMIHLSCAFQPISGKMDILGKAARRELCTCDLLDSIPSWNPRCIIHEFRLSTLNTNDVVY